MPRKKTRKKYSDATKIAAVQAVQGGKTVAATARKFGLKTDTGLHLWMQDPRYSTGKSSPHAKFCSNCGGDLRSRPVFNGVTKPKVQWNHCPYCGESLR
jgi:transposase-like protein